jgi:hypothetical protein
MELCNVQLCIMSQAVLFKEASSLKLNKNQLDAHLF